MPSKRIQWPDLLKAFAITLVVIGHVISTYDPRGYKAPITLWIYSFHMPLFMMLSGMFFEYTLDKPFWPMVKTKCRSLLLPLLSWSIVLLVFQLIVATPFCEWMTCIKEWIMSGGPLRGYWYLKCLFIYLIVGYVTVKLVRNVLIAAIITTIVFLLLPNINFLRMMIVFFWLGYGYNAVNKHIINSWWYLVIFFVIMILCYIMGLYGYTYLGTTGVYEYCKFILMGSSASLFWIVLFNMIFRDSTDNKVVCFASWIGTVSLGIYCLHALLYDPIVYEPILGNITSNTTLIFLIWSFAAIAICLGLITLILKSELLSFILLGKKYSPKDLRKKVSVQK